MAEYTYVGTVHHAVYDAVNENCKGEERTTHWTTYKTVGIGKINMNVMYTT
jgi:hypothetical protein